MNYIFSSIVFLITLAAQSSFCHAVISENNDLSTNYNITADDLAEKILLGQFKAVLYILQQPTLPFSIDVQNQNGDTFLHLLYSAIQHYPISETTYKDLLTTFRLKKFNPYVKNKDGLNFVEHREQLRGKGGQFKIISNSARILQPRSLNTPFLFPLSQNNPEIQKSLTSFTTTNNYDFTSTQSTLLKKPLQNNNAPVLVSAPQFPLLILKPQQEQTPDINLTTIEDLPPVVTSALNKTLTIQNSNNQTSLLDPQLNKKQTHKPKKKTKISTEETASRAIKNTIQDLLIEGNIEKAKEMLENDRSLLTLIIWVIGTPQLNTIRKFESMKMFLEQGADPDAINNNGYRLLFIAARNKLSNVFNLLLDHGADWNQKNTDGTTTYQFCEALNNNCLDLINKKINKQTNTTVQTHGTNPSTNSELSFTQQVESPYYDLVDNTPREPEINTESDFTTIDLPIELIENFNAVSTNHNQFQVEGDLTLNSLTQKNTVITYTQNNNDQQSAGVTKEEMQQLLLTNTDEKNIETKLKTILPQNKHLLKLLSWIIGSNQISMSKKSFIVKIFLSLGANPNLINRYKNTPLYTAYASKSIEPFNLLLSYGADWKIKNANGKNMFEICNEDYSHLSNKEQSPRKILKSALTSHIAKDNNYVSNQLIIPAPSFALPIEETSYHHSEEIIQINSPKRKSNEQENHPLAKKQKAFFPLGDPSSEVNQAILKGQGLPPSLFQRDPKWTQQFNTTFAPSHQTYMLKSNNNNETQIIPFTANQFNTSSGPRNESPRTSRQIIRRNDK